MTTESERVGAIYHIEFDHFPEMEGVYFLTDGIWADGKFCWEVAAALVIVQHDRVFEGWSCYVFAWDFTGEEKNSVHSRSGYAFKGEVGGTFKFLSPRIGSMKELWFEYKGRITVPECD